MKVWQISFKCPRVLNKVMPTPPSQRLQTALIDVFHDFNTTPKIAVSVLDYQLRFQLDFSSSHAIW